MTPDDKAVERLLAKIEYCERHGSKVVMLDLEDARALAQPAEQRCWNCGHPPQPADVPQLTVEEEDALVEEINGRLNLQPVEQVSDDAVVERKARELCAANFAEKGSEGEFGTVDDCWFAFVDEARAALTAANVQPLPDDVRETLEGICRETGRGPNGLIDWQRCVDRIQRIAAALLERYARIGDGR